MQSQLQVERNGRFDERRVRRDLVFGGVTDEAVPAQALKR